MSRVFLVCIIIFSFSINYTAAQSEKPSISLEKLDEWPIIYSNAEINADGRYVYIDCHENKVGNSMNIIKGINNSWYKMLENVSKFQFSTDGKLAIYQVKDILFLLTLGTSKYDSLVKIDSYEIVKGSKNDWILFRTVGDKGSNLYIFNTRSKKQVILNSIDLYQFFPTSENLLVVKFQRAVLQGQKSSLMWFDLHQSRSSPACLASDKKIAIIAFGDANDQYCLAEQDSAGNTEKLLIYRRGSTNPVSEVDKKDIEEMAPGFMLTSNFSNTRFTKDGKHIIFGVTEKGVLPTGTNNANVTIWRYDDQLLPIEQNADHKEYQWMASIDHRKMIPLQSEFGELQTNAEECTTNLICVKRGLKGTNFWQKEAGNTVNVISMDSTKKLIDDKALYNSAYFLSPDEKYVVYYDPLKSNYCCFNIASGKKANLTSGIKAFWTIHDSTATTSNWWFSAGVAGWLPSQQAVLIYSNYDIWKIDLKGLKKPIDITNHYGERNHLQLRLLQSRNIGYRGGKIGPILQGNEELILFAFDSATKKSGFYSKWLAGKKDPQKLNMEDFSYDRNVQKKATKANVWILRRENATQAPNLYLTSDFKTFSPLTDIHPEIDYNWLRSELVTWQLPNGQYNQGILYKPENFDSTKKYPLVFDYYEQRSNELNKYIIPQFAKDRINIPFFVSNGYLVFVPDIHFMIGHVGESALNSVTSAARYLSTLSYVDHTRMGLQGHSFGGFETNYIITHSKIFAAACEAAGSSDLISSYGMLPTQSRGISFTGPAHYYFEGYQGRIHASLGESPELYIKESPVLNVAGVTTPLLMMHNRGDRNVPWTEAGEFFTGLRRMGKRVWMLEYENGEHSLGGEQAKDYTIRMMQFFDHYLKDKPVPNWMLEQSGEDRSNDYLLSTNHETPAEKEVLFMGKIQNVNLALEKLKRHYLLN